MSDAKDAFGFGRFVPGFDFLQQLARQNAAGMPQMPSMPGMPNWIAPTFDVEEIDKRIEELKAVQFWLDQNATALKATLQALEVQKMTLAALRGMNVSMDDVASAFTARPAVSPYADVGKPITPQPAPAAAAAPAEAPAAQEQPAAEDAAAEGGSAARPRPRKKAAAAAGAGPAAPGLVDPMQWWGALTDQFQQIAGSAMKDAQRAGAAGPFANAFAQPAGSRPAAAGEAGAKKAGAKKSAAKAAAKAGSGAARKPAAKTSARRKPPARGSSSR